MTNKTKISLYKLFLFSFFISILLYSNIYCEQKFDNTGIDFDNVEIYSKRATILNPTKIIKNSNVDKIVFENNIPKDYKTAGFWISRVEKPNDVILNKKEIDFFNKNVYKMRLGISDLLNYKEEISKTRLEKTFKNIVSMFVKKSYYDENGNFVFPDFYTTLQQNIDIPNEDIIKVKYAITTAYNDVRLLPTSQKIISNINSKDIDRLQEESIDICTPVIVLCKTKDNEWQYVVTPTEEGWIQTKNLAFTDKKSFQKWIKNKSVVVVTNSKADIFLNKDKTIFLEYARLGAKFPYKSKKGKDTICVKIPTKDNNGNLQLVTGYLNYNDVNIGFLPYTQRNALTLAFSYLNSPYGWGGANAEQDCSGYLGQIYNCFGILLPETSVQKIKCGTIFYLDKNNDSTNKKKEAIMANSYAGISFVYLSGHIMLYIGEIDNNPYVIHSIWGVTTYNNNNDKTINYINRVIVSDLDIGQEVAGNSLIDRVSKFNIIK